MPYFQECDLRMPYFQFASCLLSWLFFYRASGSCQSSGYQSSVDHKLKASVLSSRTNLYLGHLFF